MNKVLVTGCNGFVGKHLVHELHARGVNVIGLGFKEPAHPEIARLLEHYYNTDLTDPKEVFKLRLQDIDAIINLAGLAKVGDSFANPKFYKKVNVSVLTNIGNELLRQNKATRLIAISSGALYDSNQPMPLTEDSKVTAKNSPYAESKLLMEEEARKLLQQGLDVVIVRPFNHIGPGQEAGFLLPDLVAKVLQASGRKHTIRVGNLKTKRDYTDVRDIARAYATLALTEVASHSLYNICSGTSIAGEEILEKLLTVTGVKDIKIVVDKSLIRPQDPTDLYGSSALLQKDTGWQPEIPLSKTIEDFVMSKT